MVSSKQAQWRGRLREKNDLKIDIPEPESPRNHEGSPSSPEKDGSYLSGKSNPGSPLNEVKQKKKKDVAKEKRFSINIPEPPDTPPSTMATILSMESSQDSSVKENRQKESSKDKTKEPLSQSTSKDTPKSSSKDTPKSSSRERTLYRKAKDKERIIREICMKEAEAYKERQQEIAQTALQNEASDAFQCASTEESSPNKVDTLGDDVASETPKSDPNESALSLTCGSVIQVPTPTTRLGPSGSIVNVPSPISRSPFKPKNSSESEPFSTIEGTPTSPQNESPKSGHSGSKVSKASPKSGNESKKKPAESRKGDIVSDKTTSHSLKKGGGKSGQTDGAAKRASFKPLCSNTMTPKKTELESDSSTSPSTATLSSKEITPYQKLFSSDQSDGATSGTTCNAVSLHVRQNSSETHFASNLSAGSTKKEGILRNKCFNDGSFLAIPQIDQSSSKTSGVSSDQDREFHLGRDMIILSEAFHLDKNTQALLAQYDARTVEDFCLMTQEDLEKLVESAAQSNRPLPPLQIRKVQVLREWAEELADQNARTAELHALCQCAADIANEHVMEQSTNLIPKDWAKQFREDLPRLKQTLKERGGSNTAAAMSWLSNFFSFPTLVCGPS